MLFTNVIIMWNIIMLKTRQPKYSDHICLTQWRNNVYQMEKFETNISAYEKSFHNLKNARCRLKNQTNLRKNEFMFGK